MDFSRITEIIFQSGVWCVLFCYLFYTTQQKNDAREEKLNNIIDKQGQTLKEISTTLVMMNERIGKLEDIMSINDDN